MIIGIGVDIVKIWRVKKVLRKYGCLFAKRILNEVEYNSFINVPENKQANYLAKRFAAKESISKAFGLGISKNLGFKDMEIRHYLSGQPYALVNLAKMPSYKDCKIQLSLSDDYPIVVAFAIVTM